ncbi:hypothetical protein CFC21_066202 [Triticum aestivum]|uniref:Cyclin-like domain-containing protein n=2 Tax=Triticum aestivum TaxID=4565 RepID=A0A9R1KMG7_WHEAT|nr:hypothetical protein CFC21_066202 [Triticum aestivum]
MAASILLCAEDSSSIFGFGDEQEAAAGARASRSPYCGGELAVEFPLPSEECVARWVATEAEHMPREDYAERLRAGGVDLRVRVDAVDWIWKVHTYYGFGSITACLALNYMDRFLSLYQIPEGKAWMTQLLSVACLSLAAKMDETSVPQSIDLQVAGDARYVFEAKTIQRMELLVLSTLKWRMQAVTPFSYLDYFLHQLCGGNAPSRQAVRDATELILCISRGAHARTHARSTFFRRTIDLSEMHRPFLCEKSHAVASQGRAAWSSGPRRSPRRWPPPWPGKNTPSIRRLAAPT